MNKQTKWLIVLVTALIVANIALVTLLWLQKNNSSHPAREDARDYLIKNLSLNNAQGDSFDRLRKDHFERIRNYQDEMRHLKDSFFNQLNQPNATPDSLSRQIGDMQSKIDLETYNHFSKLRSILNDDQKKRFDVIIQDVLHTIAPRGGPPPNGHDRHRPPPPDGPPQ